MKKSQSKKYDAYFYCGEFQSVKIIDDSLKFYSDAILIEFEDGRRSWHPSRLISKDPSLIAQNIKKQLEIDLKKITSEKHHD